MKRLLFAITFVAFVAALCFAQQPVSAVKHHDYSKILSKLVTGKIETFIPADSTKGTKSELVVADALGNKVTFTLTSATVIYDADKASVSSDKLAKNQKIEVKYHTTSAGLNEAVTILLLKQA